MRRNRWKNHVDGGSPAGLNRILFLFATSQSSLRYLRRNPMFDRRPKIVLLGLCTVLRGLNPNINVGIVRKKMSQLVLRGRF
jgi:hypothetical protein